MEEVLERSWHVGELGRLVYAKSWEGIYNIHKLGSEDSVQAVNYEIALNFWP